MLDKAPRYVGAAATGVVVVVGVLATPPDRVDTLTVILGVAAVVAGALVVGARDGLSVSASFLVYVLAAVFLGPRSAALVALTSELTASVRLRTRPRAVVLLNLPASVIPAVIAAEITRALIGTPRNDAALYLVVALEALAAFSLSFAIFALQRRAVSPDLEQFGISAFLEALPTTLLNILLVVVGAGITVKLGNAGIAFALTAVFTFSYMGHLIDRSRHRAQEYVSLSWGVLAGLMRSLDIRDGRAARHAAAVARFARDMAQSLGMDEREQELAHTAGLLHDIGHFALSDRVAERGRTLTEEDWVAIQRHPILGADMLKDLGMYLSLIHI